MARYVNITSAVHTTLVTKNTNRSGSISKITIVNNHDTNTTRVRLYIDDDTTEYTLAKTNIPPMTSLVLTDHLAFNASVYDLKLQTSEAGYDITVIIT